MAAIQVKDNTITWTSDAAKGGVTLANLPAGTYTLEEVTPPDGFTRKTETMTFTVDEHGNVTKREGLEEGESANAVIMKDAPSEVSIVKMGENGDAAQELPGAGMKLTYEGSADLSHVTAENGKIEGNEAGSKVITWTSGDKAILLKQIPDGKYTLEETAAPDGYELTTKITFEVVKGKVQNVEVGESKTNKYDETTGLITMFDALKKVTSSSSETSSSSGDNSYNKNHIGFQQRDIRQQFLFGICIRHADNGNLDRIRKQYYGNRIRYNCIVCYRCHRIFYIRYNPDQYRHCHCHQQCNSIFH